MGTPSYCIAPKSSVEVPCVGVLGEQVSGLEILLSEGGDVELGARTSKHILLFAFDELSLNPLSLFICALHHSYLICLCCPCIDSYCLSLYAWIVFVCLACA